MPLLPPSILRPLETTGLAAGPTVPDRALGHRSRRFDAGRSDERCRADARIRVHSFPGSAPILIHILCVLSAPLTRQGLGQGPKSSESISMGPCVRSREVERQRANEQESYKRRRLDSRRSGRTDVPRHEEPILLHIGSTVSSWACWSRLTESVLRMNHTDAVLT